jgi:4-hydroxy-3-methylbut-2-enyl diphosphate reductase
MTETSADRYDDPHQRYSYRSTLIEQLRAGDGELRVGRVRVLTARTFGFCWGVDRAVAMVRDALREHPGRRIWLLDQIIHNPQVNADFKEMGVCFLRGPFSESDRNGTPDHESVVVIPAFSATVEDIRMLEGLGCTVIDTTCPWVIRPHRRTLKYVEDGFTTVIHGLVQHEETRASCSLIASRGGHYLVVADQTEAARLCDVITGTMDRATFLATLTPDVHSEGFDPDVHLEHVGTINQTTMLAAETREIESMVRAALETRYGAPEDGSEHFRELNTICLATQENQDSVSEMAERGPLNLLVVVGGYDSSNTKNLTRVGGNRFPSYHVLGPEAIEGDTIRHRSPDTGEIIVTSGWLPQGDFTVGFTAGASTPDTLLGDTVRAVLEAANVPMGAVTGS